MGICLPGGCSYQSLLRPIVELLGKYAWYSQNSQDRAWPCGQLLPNELGLFDMLGNVYEWCQEQYYRYPEGEGNTTTDDMNILLSINEQNPRLLRGGAFNDLPAGVRSAFRGRNAPSYRSTLTTVSAPPGLTTDSLYFFTTSAF